MIIFVMYLGAVYWSVIYYAVCMSHSICIVLYYAGMCDAGYVLYHIVLCMYCAVLCGALRDMYVMHLYCMGDAA